MLRHAVKQAALMVPSVRRLFEQRDAARSELADLKDKVEAWRVALRPTLNADDMMPDWFLPPGPYLAGAPQRYTDNYDTYIARGGVMRPAEDVVGFVRRSPKYGYDRARFYFLCLVIDFISVSKLTGDMAELGVDKANSASVLARAAKRLDKQIYLFDTFEGFSEQDLVGDEVKHRGGYADTSFDQAKENVPGDHAHFIRGYFPETAAQVPDDTQFCLVHLDCDLYKPFCAALEFFWPRLVPGGFLIMHDYTSLYWEGVEKAVDEFFANKDELVIPIPDMSGTVVVRKMK
ncbi:TylF/MycF/NovP-related O-methyltransferase [Acidisphaera sp. S103]|uniref:TylF/MycF/NovP-related O-methyltransferase n=1 Tax=Acidisphaera sp. S103 TaxID=1747223 RepID=UPI00131E4FC2|nr:TylF/MycF/NovP-related O-methyltransferase [Acidisphaera sp. S103]